MNIGFLYNHDVLHQVRHTAPVIAELVTMPTASVTVFTSTAAQEAEVRALVGIATAARIRFVTLQAGALAEAIDRALRFIAPFRRIAVLKRNRDIFATLDALVVPETTSLLLRDRFGLSNLKMVWIPHGAGDRSVGFRPVARGFDRILLSGRKVRDRMLAAGIITPESGRIVGYPKFDTVDPRTALPPLFDNGRPTVVYNPHFDPRLSSWYAMGQAILNWFAQQDRFNLAFAPHVMLFQRRLHASVEHRRLRWRTQIDPAVRDHRHLILDTGSQRSIDMSYTRAGDIYLGDASSQIYEWIARPRPAVFLNPGRIDWSDDPNFAHWRLGRVIETMAELPAALADAASGADRFAEAQQRAFAETFSIEAEPASRRAAQAIVDLIAGSG